MFKFHEIAKATVDAIHDVKEETALHSPPQSPGIENLVEEEEEKSADTKRREKVKEHFNDMVGNTSFHGINYVIDEQYPLRRLIWLAVTLGAFIYSLTKVHECMMQYLSYPASTARMRYYLDEIEFPNVSLCNINDWRLSTMNGTLLDLAMFNEKYMKNVTYTDMKYAEVNGSHQIEEMLVDCIFNGQKCTSENFTKFKRQQGDVCFTFGTNQLIRGTGVLRSLMLTLNTQHYDYHRDKLHAGFHLFLHGKHQTPLLMQGPFISPGFATYVQVDKMKIKNLPPPYKTRCGSLDLEYFKEYSIDTCIVEQLTNYVNKECGCKETFMPGDGLNCNLTVLDNCTWPKWQKFDDEKLHDCPLPCEIDSYQPKTISYSLFPSESYAEELRRIMEKEPHMKEIFPTVNDTKRFMRDNLARLIVFYDDLSYELSELQPSYNLAAFLGDVGGQLCLFVGAGVMSYFELVDCLGLVLYTRFFESFTPKPAKI